jgi:hypothetical protein
MKPLIKFSLLCLLGVPVAVVTYAQTKPTAPTDSVKKNTKIVADSTLLATLKKYDAPRVFTTSVRLTESTNSGRLVSKGRTPMAIKGQGFGVSQVAPNGKLVLKMWNWKLKRDLETSIATLDSAAISTAMNAATTRKEQEKLVNRVEIASKRQSLNYKSYWNKSYAPDMIKDLDNHYYFIMSPDSVDQLSGIEIPSHQWDATFGVLTTPFKIRYRKFAFSNNAGIGTAIFIQKKVSANWSYGWVPGISLTSVTLDAASTTIHTSSDPTSATMPLGTSTTRPAFTPSLSFMLAYKTINFTVGIGCDVIAKPTDVATSANPEAGWMYNGKPWIGIGFGVSLFGNNSGNSAAVATSGQAAK